VQEATQKATTSRAANKRKITKPARFKDYCGTSDSDFNYIVNTMK